MANQTNSMSKTAIILLSLALGFLSLTGIATALKLQLGLQIDHGMLGIAVTVLTLLVSLAVGIFLIRRRDRAAAQSVAEPAKSPPVVDPARLARLANAARTNAIVQPTAPEPDSDAPDDKGEAISLARQRPIVFRQSFPPSADPGLSFYGGKPIGPATMEWPRHRSGEQDLPLSFVIQWDCRDLAAQDCTGLLPRDGVLYFFADLEWGNKDAWRFVHLTGEVSTWSAIAPPSDLKPFFGQQTAWQVPWCSARVPPEMQDCPVLLPKWPFAPLAFDYPQDPDPDPEDGPFWHEKTVAEALVAAQDSLGTPLIDFDPKRPSTSPFPAFPHDWAAVRIVCSKVIDSLTPPIYSRLPKAIEDLEGDAREAMITEWRDEATELYQFAISHPLTSAVPADLSGQIRVWMDKVNGCFTYSQAVETSVNASLGLGSTALDAIPADTLARISLKHALGLAYDRDEYRREFDARCCQGLDQAASDAKWNEAQAAGTPPKVRMFHAPSPNRMFGPASYVQGGVEELIADHLLLLEISSSSPIGIELGEGVIQYMIRPADLAAGRFERAVVVMSAY